MRKSIRDTVEVSADPARQSGHTVAWKLTITGMKTHTQISPAKIAYSRIRV